MLFFFSSLLFIKEKQIHILVCFLKDYVTLKTGVMAAEHFKYIKI